MPFEINPISLDRWLPDRCLAYTRPVPSDSLGAEGGCPSLSRSYTNGDRCSLVALYRDVLEEIGCCGFVASEGGAVVGYNNFFPSEYAGRIKFYGWGGARNMAPGSLVHNCLSMIRSPAYRRQGIGTMLIKQSLDWARAAGWRRFEVYNVLPDDDIAFQNDQKSCRSFWRKLGFEIVDTVTAPASVKQAYGLVRLHAMALNLLPG